MADKKATRAAYGITLATLAKTNDKIVVLDADLAAATTSGEFKKQFPERFYNAGIAECNLVGMSAGLSTMGLIPFCSTFAMFGAGRAYEIFRNAVAYPHFNVKLCCTHAGITVGEDGGSHQAIEDIALMREIPGNLVVVPADYNEAVKAITALAEYDGPSYLRLGRAPSEELEDLPFELGKANVLKEGTDAVVFACGFMVAPALNAAKALEAEGKSVAVVNIHTIKPIDSETILKYASKTKNVITVEEHSIIGGLGDAVAGVVVGKIECKFKKIGINDEFGQSGKYQDLLVEYKLDEQSILDSIKAAL